MNLAGDDPVLDIVSEVIFSNDPGLAAKVISIALIRLENGSSLTAQAALDYACEQVLED